MARAALPMQKSTLGVLLTAAYLPARPPRAAETVIKPSWVYCVAATLHVFARGIAFTAGSVVAIRMPRKTATRPATRLAVIGSPTSWVASNPAAIGFTVIVLATSVGVVR